MKPLPQKENPDMDSKWCVFSRRHARAEALEEAAAVAETYPDRILMFWERPGGPPGNGYRPAHFADIAAAIRSLPANEEKEG